MHLEFEALMERLVPGCSQHWEGAAPEEIDELEHFAGQLLPSFLGWFLARMGRDMGPLAIPRRDMRIGTILSIYRSGLKLPPGLVLIASEEDEQMPMYMFCDLRFPMRDDARVCSGEKVGGPLQLEFETMRESLAWDIFRRTQLKGRLRCGGMLRCQTPDILTQIDPILQELAFECLQRLGPRCGLYMRAKVALECYVPINEEELPRRILFEMAGDEAEIRSLLGVLSMEAEIDIKIRRWLSPLDLPLVR